MSLRKRLKDFRKWCPQPPTRSPVKLRSYSVPFAAVLVAALAFGVFLSLPSFQSSPIKPTLPQIPSVNTTHPSLTPTALLPTPTSTPVQTATPAPTSSPTQPPPIYTPTQGTPTNGILELTMFIEKTVFSVGEPVDITLTITNISNQTVNIGDSAWTLDFIVSDGTHLIYQHTLDGMIPLSIRGVTLAPGDNITNSYVWSQRYSGVINPGPAVSSGTYYVIGKSDATEPSYTLQTDPVQIVIAGS